VLRETGYTTRIQEYDFAIGKSIVDAMDLALKECRYIACLLSPAYLEPKWCSEEWQAGLVKNRLFVLRIAECALDGLLGARAYLELIDVSDVEAQEQILNELKKRDGADLRTETKPAFPGGPATQPRPRFPGSLPAIWNITEERNRFFTGRDELLHNLHEALSAGETAALTEPAVGSRLRLVRPRTCSGASRGGH
jgi:hypothetical protein